MRRVIKHHPKDRCQTLKASVNVTLSFNDRHRRRIRLIDDNGEEFLLDLVHATYMDEGDFMELDTGGAICVVAALEDVMDITCKGAKALAQISWHIGNRHTPMQVLSKGVLRLEYDHVLFQMVEGLGGECERNQASFSPEPGAYESGGHHHHD